MKNAGDTFGRLNNHELNRELLDQYVADLEAMRLGWPSAAYAEPGLARAGEYSEPIWNISRHPSLSDDRLSRFMSDGRALALRDLNVPPQRFLALLDENMRLMHEQEDDDEPDVFVG